MRIELLFHVVYLLCCLEVRFVQYCRNKSDRLIMLEDIRTIILARF